MHRRLFLLCLCAVPLNGQTPPPSQDPSEIKPASLSGRTVAADGVPVRKAVLILRPSLSATANAAINTIPYSATSDSDGKFVFEAVDPGRYTLHADRAGYQPHAYGARHARATGTVLSLTSGQHLSDVDFVLTPKIVLSGKVLDSDGDPVPMVAVNALRFAYDSGKRELVPAGSAWSDDNGDYKIDSLEPGKYYLCAAPQRDQFPRLETRSAAAPPPPGQSPKREEAQIATYYPGVTDASAAVSIDLADGRNRPGANITIRKSPVYHVRGKVAGQTGEGSHLRVFLAYRSSTMERLNMKPYDLDRNGAFDAFPVSPGSYLLLLTTFQNAFKVLGSRSIEITSGNVEDITLAAQPTVNLTGRVLRDPAMERNPAPQPNRSSDRPHVFLQSADGFPLGIPDTAAESEDSFRLVDVTPGRYQVNVNSIPKGSYLKAIRFGDQDVLASGLTVAPGGASPPLEIILGVSAATISGAVEDAEGKAVTPAVITLVPDPLAPERQDLFKQSNADQNGRFTLDSIAPGKYRLYAWTDLEPGSQFDPDFLKDFESKSVKLEIAESAALRMKLIPADR